MKRFIIFLVFLLILSPVITNARNTDSIERINYIKNELARHHFSSSQIKKILSNPKLKIAIKKKPIKINWSKLEKSVLSEDSINQGKDFLKKYSQYFTEAENQYGIPKETIAAIIRIETNFGEFFGNDLIVSVFYSKAMKESNKKWKSAADNFVDFLIYTKQFNWDPFQIYGSYAGAFGLCQFLPYSALKYGVAANGGNKANLFQAPDAILSIANYLAAKNYNKNPTLALADYYGNGSHYPEIILKYAEALK
jgi:membrane-bound lytic murein transglycosylase B